MNVVIHYKKEQEVVSASEQETFRKTHEVELRFARELIISYVTVMLDRKTSPKMMTKLRCRLTPILEFYHKSGLPLTDLNSFDVEEIKNFEFISDII